MVHPGLANAKVWFGPGIKVLLSNLVVLTLDHAVPPPPPRRGAHPEEIDNSRELKTCRGGRGKNPINIKNFGGTPPLLHRKHPLDMSHLSRGNVPSVPHMVCPIYVVFHINQVRTLVAQSSATPATVAATPQSSATPFQTQTSVRPKMGETRAVVIAESLAERVLAAIRITGTGNGGQVH